MGDQQFLSFGDYSGKWITRNGSKVVVVEILPKDPNNSKAKYKGYGIHGDALKVPLTYWDELGNAYRNMECCDRIVTLDLSERIRDASTLGQKTI